jgi:hypothetical protein
MQSHHAVYIIHLPKFLANDRKTEFENDRQDKNNMPPIFDLGGIKISRKLKFS